MSVGCQSCGAPDFRVYSSLNRNRVVVCGRCGHFYVNPVPPREELRARVTDSGQYTDDQLAKVGFFTRRAVALFERVERVRAPGRVLDVGCAIGTELLVARERGWEGVGLELARSSVEVARSRGLDVRQVALEDAALEAGSFDLVTLNHVLEHIPDALSFLGEVRRLLRPDGLLFVAVPNVRAWIRYLRGERYAWTFQDDHFAHYSTRTLEAVLRRSGFRVLELETSRWRDFHAPLAERPVWFRAVNAAVERVGLGIEIFCLATPEPPASGGREAD